MSSAHASAIAPQFGGAQRTACAGQHVRYDALVSINVPSDKARAVVDAMERDMGTTLATKQDLLLIRQEIENRYTLLWREIDSLRGEVGKDLQSLRSDVSKDLEALRLSMTLRLGSMLFIGFGLTLAALRLWL